MRTRAVVIAAVSLGGILLFSGGTIRAAEGSSAQAIEKARGATDHAELAEQYTKDAEELRKQADKYKRSHACRSSRLYRKVQLRWSGRSSRCRERIDQYQRAAKEAEALAREHRELAGQSG
jgi:hypothetical protein